MSEIVRNEVVAGTYMDVAGHTHKVLGIAEHQHQGSRAVIFIPSYGEKAGQLLMEDVGMYLDLYIQSGGFKYQGPHPRIVGSYKPSPTLMFGRKAQAAE